MKHIKNCLNGLLLLMVIGLFVGIFTSNDALTSICFIVGIVVIRKTKKIKEIKKQCKELESQKNKSKTELDSIERELKNKKNELKKIKDELK